MTEGVSRKETVERRLGEEVIFSFPFFLRKRRGVDSPRVDVGYGDQEKESISIDKFYV